MTVVTHEPIEKDKAHLPWQRANQLPKGINVMKSTNTSILRSWSTSKLLTSLLAIGLLLPNSGCRLGHSGDPPAVGWQDWLPPSFRGLVRNRLQTEQDTAANSSETAVAASTSPQDGLRDIAPLPPKTDSETLPLAPMPANDVPELVAIDNDLPELQAVPAEAPIAEEAAKNKVS